MILSKCAFRVSESSILEGQGSQKLPQRPQKSDLKINAFFHPKSKGKLMQKGYPKGVEIAPRSLPRAAQKNTQKKRDFGSPEGLPQFRPESPQSKELALRGPPQQHTRPHKTPTKSLRRPPAPTRPGASGPERILGGFGVVWGVILGAKGRPKWLQNLIKKMSDFWIALGSALGRQRAGLRS